MSVLWVARRTGLQIDSLPLDEIFLGKKKLSSDETVRQWNQLLSARVQLLDRLHSDSKTPLPEPSSHLNLGDGGALQKELDAAIAIVQRLTYPVVHKYIHTYSKRLIHSYIHTYIQGVVCIPLFTEGASVGTVQA